MSSVATSAPAIQLPPPTWAAQLVNGRPNHIANLDGVALYTRLNSDFSLVSARITGATALGREQLGETVHHGYTMIADVLKDAAAKHPVRFWNHICRIHEPMGAGMDRYMAFNAGRFRAFAEWYGGEANFDRCIATATGVGCHGDDVVIHVLAASRPGVAVANPRQVQPFHYSQRFGPQPPCFARATTTRLPSGHTAILIGGTASIRGEESVCVGDLQGQLAETVENIRVLLKQAGGSLANVDNLRVYAPDVSTWETIQAATKQAMPHAVIELMQADLCRTELLVEIEGRAVLKGALA